MIILKWPHTDAEIGDVNTLILISLLKKFIKLVRVKETLGKFHHWFENHEFLNFAEESSNVKPYLSNPDKTSMWAHNCFWILNRQSLNCKLKYIFITQSYSLAFFRKAK